MTVDTQNPGGWPDAARPGVPMEPNESRYHWLARKGTSYPGVACFPSFWNAADEDFPGVRDAAERFDYLGPCLLPSEVAAREAAARREGIEAALNACLRREHFHTVDDYDGVNDDLRADGARGCIAAIRALLEDGR